MSNVDSLKKLKNAVNGPLLDMERYQERQVKIEPDKKIEPGMFLADDKIPFLYRAHPQTIRALKKDIFLAGDDWVDLVEPYVCNSCHRQLDKQFWLFCPLCGAKFS